MSEPVEELELRRQAEKRLRAKRDLGANALAYVLVNGFLVGIWFVSDPGGFFWPLFPLAGWGIGLVFHAWDVYSGPPSERAVQAEMDRLRRR